MVCWRKPLGRASGKQEANHGNRTANMKAIIGKTVSAAVLILAAGLATPSFAQSTGTAAPQDDAASLDDIIVTAQRREQSLQDVPIAITAFNAETLERTAAQGIQDVASKAPGVTLTQFNIGEPQLYIRGVGTASDVAIAFAASSRTTARAVRRIRCRPCLPGGPPRPPRACRGPRCPSGARRSRRARRRAPWRPGASCSCRDCGCAIGRASGGGCAPRTQGAATRETHCPPEQQHRRPRRPRPLHGTPGCR